MSARNTFGYTQSPAAQRRRTLATEMLVRSLMNQDYTNPGAPWRTLSGLLGHHLMTNRADKMEATHRKNYQDALAAALQGRDAKPWTNPDTGQVTGPAGGIEGMVTALGAPNLKDNPFAADWRGQIAMANALKPPTEKFEVVQDPYGRGGVGQRSTLTGKIHDYIGPEKPRDDRPAFAKELGYIRTQLNSLPQDHPDRPLLEARLKKTTESQPLVNIGGSDFDEGTVSRYEEARAAFGEADSKLAGIAEMERLVPLVDSGFGAETRLQAKKAMRTLGFEVDDAEIASAEALRAKSMDFVMQQVSKTKGAVSNKEMDLFAAAAPSLMNTPAGNKLMLSTARRSAERERHLSEFAMKLVRENPGLNRFELDRAMMEERQKLQSVPMFTPEEQQVLTEAAGQKAGAPQYGGSDDGFMDRMRSYGALPGAGQEGSQAGWR